MLQTKGVTRLIQLEMSASALKAPEEFADSSAVMDGGFGGISAGKCAGRARGRISQPTRVCDNSRFSGTSTDWAHDKRNVTRHMLAMSRKNYDFLCIRALTCRSSIWQHSRQ